MEINILEEKIEVVEQGEQVVITITPVSFAESDPVFMQSEASKFETGDKEKLDSLVESNITETDPVWNSEKSNYYQKAQVDTLLTSKANSIHTHNLSDLNQDINNRTVSDEEKSTWNNKQNALGYTPENLANKNQPNGYAGLDENTRIPSSLLPSFVDDVLEYANLSSLPITGETGKIYITTNNNKQYRWSGSTYTEITSSPSSTDAVPEGSTNLYFTNSRVLNALLTGISFVTSTAIEATDSIIQAFGKLQAQITNLFDNKTDTNGNNSAITYENFTPSAEPPYQRGRVWYDDTNDALSVFDRFSGTSIQLGKELIIDARNNSGATILNGQVVYISNALGQYPTIALARADAISTSEIIGVATHNILNNETGKVTISGLVNALNTGDFNDGEAVYLSATIAGGVTNAPPASPNNVVFVGKIAHAHNNLGKLLVIPSRPLSNNNNLGTSQIISPTQNAIKEYIASQLSSLGGGKPRIVKLTNFSSATRDNSNGGYSVEAGNGFLNGGANTSYRIFGDARAYNAMYPSLYTKNPIWNATLRFGDNALSTDFYHSVYNAVNAVAYTTGGLFATENSGLGFIYKRNSSTRQLFAYSCNGVASTFSSDLASMIAGWTIYIDFTMVYNSATSAVDFYINGNLASSINTNLPPVNQLTSWGSIQTIAGGNNSYGWVRAHYAQLSYDAY